MIKIDSRGMVHCHLVMLKHFLFQISATLIAQNNFISVLRSAYTTMIPRYARKCCPGVLHLNNRFTLHWVSQQMPKNGWLVWLLSPADLQVIRNSTHTSLFHIKHKGNKVLLISYFWIWSSVPICVFQPVEQSKGLVQNYCNYFFFNKIQ